MTDHKDEKAEDPFRDEGKLIQVCPRYGHDIATLPQSKLLHYAFKRFTTFTGYNSLLLTQESLPHGVSNFQALIGVAKYFKQLPLD